MNRERIGQLVFLGAVAVAAALYGLTAPEGLPWNDSVRLAARYVGQGLTDLPAGEELPHPIWGFHVQTFGGAVSLAIGMAALAAGLLGALVNRHFGWRFATSAALVWIFLPGVWNRAITGERGVCVAAMVVVAAWVTNAAVLWIFRKARVAHEVHAKYAKVNRIAGWAALGAAGIFAVVSMSLHDYKLGEAASVFARGVVEAAGERIIVANGFCDEQIEREVRRRGEGEERVGEESWWIKDVVFLRNDEAYRRKLVEWVRREWSIETNLWMAAHVSAAAFVKLALKQHPERFYLMNGMTTTLEQWEKRWNDFKPYLKSSDKFVAVGRRLFGYEGNALANASQTPQTDAWRLYKRIYEEIDSGNIAALVNMSEMIRRGFAVSGTEKQTVQTRLDAFFNDLGKREHAREIIRAAGPVRVDAAMMEKMASEAKKRIAERIAAGEKVEVAPEVMSLVEWNNEMCQLMDRGEVVKAGRIARQILSNPKWREFIPANATMGTLLAKEGDYVASETFFRVATDTTNAIPTVVLNDYADTLMNLGKLEAAEKMARRAVAESKESQWLARLTLAEVLEKRTDKDRSDEIRTLLKSVLRSAPASVRDRIRNQHKDFVR